MAMLGAAMGSMVRPYMPASGMSMSSSARRPQSYSYSNSVPTWGSRPCRPAQVQVMAKKKLEGKVVHSAHKNTIKVEVVRWEVHPMYKRIWKRKTFYMAHDPEEKFKAGDLVELQKCQPISKKKHHIAIPLTSRSKCKSTSTPPTKELNRLLETIKNMDLTK